MSHNTESIFRAYIDAERPGENLTRYQHVAGSRAALARRRTQLQWRKFEESKRTVAKRAYTVEAVELGHNLPAEGYPLWSKRAARPQPVERDREVGDPPRDYTPLQPHHLTAYGATQEQAERVLRDQSEDRRQPKFLVVGVGLDGDFTVQRVADRVEVGRFFARDDTPKFGTAAERALRLAKYFEEIGV